MSVSENARVWITKRVTKLTIIVSNTDKSETSVLTNRVKYTKSSKYLLFAFTKKHKVNSFHQEVKEQKTFLSFNLKNNMDNTTINSEKLLVDLNNEKASLMTPVMVYLTVLMIIGLVGNAMVCFYYSCKSRQSSNTVFIVAVAVYDLIICGLSIPIEIVDLRFFYLFTNSGACKFLRFINYFGAIGSVVTLLVVSIDRYRKICRPSKKQFKIKDARLACGLSIVISLLFSWPALVFYQSVKVDVFTDDGIMLKGYDCTTTRDDSYKIYLWIFNGFYMVCFLISSVVLCVMYGLVGRVLFRHKKMRKRYGSKPSSNSNLNSSGTETHLTEMDRTKSADRNKYLVNEPKLSESDAATRRSVINMVASRAQSSLAKSQSPDIKTVRYTTMMLVITVVFIVSFLPHLILSLWRAFMDEYEGDLLSDAGLVAFQLGLRSYFLNSAINPFTYGFFNPKFRKFFYLTFCPCCRKMSETNTVSTSSGDT